MSLDVAPPDPPELEPQTAAVEHDDAETPADTETVTDDGEADDYRREELQAFLEEGAWEEAFDEWAAQTDMDEETFDVVTDLELFSRFDFFWDDFADRVGYHAPGIPEDWRERDIHPGLDSWGTVSTINAGLTEFGQTVCDVLKSEYIDWAADYEPPDDVPDFDA